MSRSSYAESHSRVQTTVLRGDMNLYVCLAVWVEVRVCWSLHTDNFLLTFEAIPNFIPQVKNSTY